MLPMIPIVKVIPDSFQEYEGYHSLVLFCFGCNLDCSYCYNKDFVSDENNIIGYAEELIEKHLNPMHEAVVLLGGEFLIYDLKPLSNLLKLIKKKGLKIKLYTNGQFPQKVLLLKDYWDSVSVDFKTVFQPIVGKNVPVPDYLDNLKRTFQCLRDNKIEFEIRTTKHSKMTDMELDIIGELAKEMNVEHIIQKEIASN